MFIFFYYSRVLRVMKIYRKTFVIEILFFKCLIAFNPIIPKQFIRMYNVILILFMYWLFMYKCNVIKIEFLSIW